MRINVRPTFAIQSSDSNKCNIPEKKPKQIEIIKQALLYDLPQSIVDLENKLFNQNNSCKEMEGIDLNAHTGKFKKYIYTTYESTSKLWEYNNNALEKEL